jgi:hypothetical protein
MLVAPGGVKSQIAANSSAIYSLPETSLYKSYSCVPNPIRVPVLIGEQGRDRLSNVDESNIVIHAC